MMANISVSGKIIEEISEKVPSTNFAIIELIKNSYEAKASSISINIFDDKIEFFDDGDGMDSEDIKSLLVVSSSNKVYGKRIGKRIISGEKGHGFYSVFKFGSLVTIETIKNNTMNTFTLDMNVIRKASDISKYDIDINTISLQQKRNTGTKITVHNLYADSLNILKRSLDNKSKYSKLAKCIIDEEFNIEINKLWKNSIEYIENENIDKINEYFISVSKFNSTVHKKDNGEYFYTLQRLNDVINVEIPSKYNNLLDDENLSLEFEIKIFSLKSGGLKYFSSFYKDIDEKMISPQIYFNNVYFDHSQLYNVNIFTSKKSGEVLRQQTGIINIHLYEPGVLDFNSDRSNITESEKSLLLKEFLDFISASIQINTKEILAKETGDEPSITKFEIIVNDAIPDKIKVKNDLQTIDYNGVIQESFDVSKVGIWTLIYKNNEKYIINVIDYPDPTFKLIIKKLIVGIEYNLDEIIKFTDCCGTERIVPKLEYFPVDSRIFDKKNKTLQVNQSGILRIKGSFTDKISNKSKKIDIDVLVDQKVSAEINIKNNVFISPSTYLGSNIKSNISKDIVDFINAINELYTNKINIIVIVSSLRTLIELMCCDILDVFEIDKQLYLKDNAREIFRDGYFEKCIDDNIEDIRINKSLKSIYNIHKSVLQDGSFIDKYNLATHTGIRLIGSAEIERDIIIVNLIYTYLILVSREK